jgi:hypothetical protein
MLCLSMISKTWTGSQFSLINLGFSKVTPKKLELAESTFLPQPDSEVLFQIYQHTLNALIIALLKRSISTSKFIRMRFIR